MILLALMAALALLTLDLAPAVPPSPPPTGQEAAQARATIVDVRTAIQAPGGAPVTLSADQLATLSRMASRVGDGNRLSLAIMPESALMVRVSHALPGPLWLNVHGTIAPDPSGFPRVSITIGRLPLGAMLSRRLIELGAALMRWRGVQLPPLEQLVSDFRVTPDAVAAKLWLPGGSGLIQGLPGIAARIDGAAVARRLCRLTAAPAQSDLAGYVRLAFADHGSDGDPAAANRERLVALAMLTVGEQAGQLAPGAVDAAAGCVVADTPLLNSRADLSKHWSLSAALAATFDANVSNALGQWKELADSQPNGSGFSFIDLSADRSGVLTARLATDPATAAAEAARLARAQPETLLPLAAMRNAEGLSEADFGRAYGNVDSARYGATVALIDRTLAAARAAE